MNNGLINPAVSTGTLCVFNDATIGDTFCSFQPDTMDGKLRLFNAINNPDKRIGNCINKEIAVKDVIVKAVKLSEDRNKKPSSGVWVDENGERNGFRVVLIDVDGVSYTATSNGIYNSISTLRAVFGDLHFDTGLRVEVNQISTKNGSTLTLKALGLVSSAE